MLRHVIWLVAGCFFVMYSVSVSAYTTLADRSVKLVHVNGAGGIYFETNEPMENPDSCMHGSLYHVPTSSQYEKEIYALLLAAYTRGSGITFVIEGCSANYPKVMWVRALP